MKIYKYFINLDERGSFYADVRNQAGKTVFEIKAGNELAEDESSIFNNGSKSICGEDVRTVV